MRARLRLTGFAVTAVLLLATGIASADEFEAPNFERGFRLVWRPLSFTASSGQTVRCNVTLTGSFLSRSFGKTIGSQVARVSGTRVESCSGGTVTVLTATLPWELRYVATTGTLPSIDTVSLNLIRAAFSIRTGEGLQCLAATEASHPQPLKATLAEWTEEPTVVGSGEVISAVEAESRAAIPLTGSFLCPLATGALSGTAAATLIESTTKPRLAQPGIPLSWTMTPVNPTIRLPITAQTMTIENTAMRGGPRLLINEIGLSNAARFLLNDTNACHDKVLARGENCAISVALRFGPPPVSTRIIANSGGNEVSQILTQLEM